MEHIFKLEADWQGGRGGEGNISSGGLVAGISIPETMGGPGTGTNPDEMLLGAASTCYLITLAAMLERSGITPLKLSLYSEGVVDVTNGVFTYRSITHKPTIVLDSAEGPGQLRITEKLAYKAEESCMISRAMKGNVELAVVPDIQIAVDEGGEK